MSSLFGRLLWQPPWSRVLVHVGCVCIYLFAFLGLPLMDWFCSMPPTFSYCVREKRKKHSAKRFMRTWRKKTYAIICEPTNCTFTRETKQWFRFVRASLRSDIRRLVVVECVASFSTKRKCFFFFSVCLTSLTSLCYIVSKCFGFVLFFVFSLLSFSLVSFTLSIACTMRTQIVQRMSYSETKRQKLRMPQPNRTANGGKMNEQKKRKTLQAATMGL